MTETVLQGHDLVIELELINDSDETPIPIASLNDYHIYIYKDSMRKELVLSFKKTPGAGDKAIKVEDDANGKISFIIPRSWTKTAAAQTYFAEFIKKVVAGVEFEGERFVTGGELKDLFEFKVLESAKPTAMA